MASPLESIPLETLDHILSFLPIGEVARLARTSKHLSIIVTPLLWSDIHFGYTGWSQHDPTVFRPPHKYAFHDDPPEADRDALLEVLLTLHKSDPDRMQALTARVKHLGGYMEHVWSPFQNRETGEISVDTIPSWHLIPYFSNLETLDLCAGYFSGTGKEIFLPPIDATAPALPRLRAVRLFGYIPRTAAQFILKSGPTLEHLELGLLDRPICEGNFPPLPEENLNLSSDESGSDYGSLFGYEMIPRPLGNFLPPSAGGNGEPAISLPKLKHLRLVQPSRNREWSNEYNWSTRAEEACLLAWRGILRAAGASLEVLVLDQRPAAVENVADSESEHEYVGGRSDPQGHRQLIGMVQSVMMEGQGLEKLKQVYLAGIDVGITIKGRETGTTLAREFMYFLRTRGVKCEARVGKWCMFERFVGVVYDSTFSWEGSEVDGDQGDYDDEVDNADDRDEGRWKKPKGARYKDVILYHV
ncbi:hypothetical protein B0I35DRAFT_434060 [Stachybotrys elegans]|uniref:F-box domain-containing protein n=1 Tax=Stachybotrys elegans TaxID=80388 RepID=A0A8K0SKJ5_9HYPO|nr:hypothetical protein B0I35DRAFT_434060 [Stachybotrys elegans]